ncbi:MAG: hypothetical protein ACOY3I_04220 [Verrucomicrobiota bacterium]
MKNRKYLCPNCRSDRTIKDGSVFGSPRRQCKNCGFKFLIKSVNNDAKNLNIPRQLFAPWLYMHGLKVREIASFLHCSPAGVLHWYNKLQVKHRPLAPYCDVMVFNFKNAHSQLQEMARRQGLKERVAKFPVALIVGNCIVVTTEIPAYIARIPRKQRKIEAKKN